MPDPKPARLAVLIDADNASYKIADALFREIAKIGEASVRRIYGDFSTTRLKGWADILSEYAILPQQQFAYTTGKNSSDIALVIDALDLLHRGKFDGICLVSSDSDFTRLAAYIREQGIDVYGFGEKKTPQSFRNACHRFIYTENLHANAAGEAASSKPLMNPTEAVPLIQQAMSQVDVEDDWVPLGRVGTQLAAIASDFDARNYGFAKLSELVRQTGAFDLEKREGNMLCLRIKEQPKKTSTRRRTQRKKTAKKNS